MVWDFLFFSFLMCFLFDISLSDAEYVPCRSHVYVPHTAESSGIFSSGIDMDRLATGLDDLQWPRVQPTPVVKKGHGYVKEIRTRTDT